MTWQSNHSGSYRTYGRRFDEEGNPETGEFVLYESTGTGQGKPDVTALPDGGYLATWQDWSMDGSNNGIYAQRFDAENRGMGQF